MIQNECKCSVPPLPLWTNDSDDTHPSPQGNQSMCPYPVLSGGQDRRPRDSHMVAQLQVVMEAGRGSGSLAQCHSEFKNRREDGLPQKVSCPSWLLDWMGEKESGRARNRPVSARKTCETPSRSFMTDYELKGGGRCVYFTQSFSGHPCGSDGDPGARMT